MSNYIVAALTVLSTTLLGVLGWYLKRALAGEINKLSIKIDKLDDKLTIQIRQVRVDVISEIHQLRNEIATREGIKKAS